MHSKISHEIYLYLLTLLITLTVLAWVFYLPGFSLTLPMGYQEDALFTGVGVKSIIETGWYLTNPNLGAPGSYQLFDYPSVDNANFLILKMLTFFLQNYAVVMNLFYFLTFPLIALTSLFVFRKLGLNKFFAVTASILFAFMPYHLFRGEAHLFLSAYYVVPLYVLLFLLVFNNEKISSRQAVIYALLITFAASTGVYYAFFACYFLVVAGFCSGVNLRSWQPLGKALIIIACIGFVCFLNLLPNKLAESHLGKNIHVAKRHPNETENASLKISQMLLPVDGHRLKPLRKLKDKYNRSAFLINENRSATLGLIGSLGFLVLIAVLFIKRESKLKNQLFYLSCLTLSGVLLGTMGGFSSLFSYSISPTIRSYNRISIFIAFFALVGFFLVLQRLLNKENYAKYTGVIAASLLVIGLLDQVGYSFRPDYVAINQEYNQDEKFVANLEATLPANAMIFQLPVTNFPENAVVLNMKDYELFKPYLHSHHLRWSYGAIKGRETYEWQKQVAQLSVKEMITRLKNAGFVGLYIQQEGFADNGASLEHDLTQYLKRQPLRNENGKVSVYLL